MMNINATLVRQLISSQFPQWADLPIKAVEVGGWDEALASTWHSNPVWIHGDIVIDNLLVKKGRLSAVIDFGCMGIGDPACDLAIAWTLFKGKSRDAFRAALPLDCATWVRGRGWALWKALILCVSKSGTSNLKIEKSRQVIDEVLADSLHT